MGEIPPPPSTKNKNKILPPLGGSKIKAHKAVEMLLTGISQ